jgi:hypothetical protein
MIVTANGDYLLKQRQPFDLCNGAVRCFLRGTGSILIYYLDELRLQRADTDCGPCPGQHSPLVTLQTDVIQLPESGTKELTSYTSHHTAGNSNTNRYQSTGTVGLNNVTIAQQIHDLLCNTKVRYRSDNSPLSTEHYLNIIVLSTCICFSLRILLLQRHMRFSCPHAPPIRSVSQFRATRNVSQDTVSREACAWLTT